MTLDDLLRDTLASRAHDVDGVDLLAAVPAAPAAHGLSRRGRAWAVTAVVAVAAVVVGVLVATLGPGSERATPVVSAPADPPAGMQFVSYHGLTLTVPAAWPVVAFGCEEPATDAVIVPVAISAACAPHIEASTPANLTMLYLNSSSDGSDGQAVTIAGRPATRSVAPDPRFPGEVLVAVRFTSPDFSISVRAIDEMTANAVIDTARSTPVDTRGCIESLDADEPSGNPVTDRLVPGIPIGVVVCLYLDTTDTDSTLWLSASRELRSEEVSDLVSHLSSAPVAVPASTTGGSGSYSLPVRYLFRFADGSSRVIDVRPSGNSIVASDGSHRVDLGDFTWNPPSAFAH